jgi:hypothetical protein
VTIPVTAARSADRDVDRYHLDPALGVGLGDKVVTMRSNERDTNRR